MTVARGDGVIGWHRSIRGYPGIRGMFNPTPENKGKWFPRESQVLLGKRKGRAGKNKQMNVYLDPQI